jgi:hypothetical protein
VGDEEGAYSKRGITRERKCLLFPPLLTILRQSLCPSFLPTQHAYTPFLSSSCTRILSLSCRSFRQPGTLNNLSQSQRGGVRENARGKKGDRGDVSQTRSFTSSFASQGILHNLPYTIRFCKAPVSLAF